MWCGCEVDMFGNGLLLFCVLCGEIERTGVKCGVGSEVGMCMCVVLLFCKSGCTGVGCKVDCGVGMFMNSRNFLLKSS